MRSARQSHVTIHPFRRRGIAAAVLTAALLATNVSGIAAGAQTSDPGADPAVITDWNAVAVATIVTDAGKANAEAFLWYAFAQAAVYNAVVGSKAAMTTSRRVNREGGRCRLPRCR